MDDCNFSVKKNPLYIKEWMARCYSPPSDKSTHYFKKWTAASGVLKNKMLFLQKFDRSS